MELEKLKRIVAHGTKDPGAVVDDPLTVTPDRDGKPLTPQASRALVELAMRTSNRKAAEEVGVSERTVERHRSCWTGGNDAESVKLQRTSAVDDRLCAAMRCAAEDGDTLQEIADRHNLALSTVQHHVSVNSAQPCVHRIPVTIPRVSFKHGGYRGGPHRKRDASGKFVSD